MSNKLSKEKIDYFKKRLWQMKREHEESIQAHQGTGPNDTAQEFTNFANHPADMGTEQFEQEREAGFTLMHKESLQEINDALERIEKGTFGISEISGKPIPEERLEVMPTARNLVEED